jgi:hypothetical protein
MNLKKHAKVFAKRVSNEAKETREAANIIAKYAKGEKITEEEGESLKKQFYDVLKIAGIGIPFTVIPGSSILLPLIVSVSKKKGINILPSSFEHKKCYCGNPVDESNPDCVEFNLCKDHSQDV